MFPNGGSHFTFVRAPAGFLMIMWQCTGEEGALPKGAKMYKRVDVDAFVGRTINFNTSSNREKE